MRIGTRIDVGSNRTTVLFSELGRRVLNYLKRTIVVPALFLVDPTRNGASRPPVESK
jgi:hypothetical protein